jgi:hypothetical protein
MSYEQSPKTFFKVFRILVFFLLASIITLTVLVVRNSNETNRRFSNNSADLTTRLDSLNNDFKTLVRADCPFLRNVYLLPNASQQRPPSGVVVQLSDTARDAYYAKGCAEQLGTLPKLNP